MKRLTSLFATILVTLAVSAAKTPEVTSIEPPYWWTGMSNDTLQLLVNGPDIASRPLSVDYPGVRIVDRVADTSPNYQIVYLTISPDTPAGTMNIVFGHGRNTLSVPYQLKERLRDGASNPGFDSSDVLYLIMPDRFADGDTAINNVVMAERYETDRAINHARHGGDLKGISDHLDYIDSLGVTAIWLCPVLENDMPGGSYHGYATTDYYNIDPRFGSNDVWRDLIAQCHDRGIKVVMDMIFNHSGSSHPWLADMPMADWYNHPGGDLMTNFRLSTVHDPYVTEYDKEATVNGWFVKSMPDLNQRNKHVARYLTQNSIFWIEDSQIDGIRMDTYPYADQQAMAQWISDVEAEYPNFNIVGECWYGNEGGEAFWQRHSPVNPVDPNLPTVMDFIPAIKGRQAFTEATDPWNGLNIIYDHLALDYLFPDPSKILTFLDNHDTDRFLAAEPDDIGSWRQALTWLVTTRGIPQIYYGTEILMNGTRAEGGDGNVRRDMPGGWQGDSINAFTGQGLTPLQTEALDYTRRLLNWRKSRQINPILARGSLKHFMPQTGLYIYERRLDDRYIIVIMNGNDNDITVEMTRYAEMLPQGSVHNDFITGENVTIDSEMTFSPRQIMILTSPQPAPLSRLR